MGRALEGPGEASKRTQGYGCKHGCYEGMYLPYEAIRPEETRCSSSAPDTKKSRSCIKDLVLKHGRSTGFLQARPHALSPHTAHQAVTTDGSLLPATSPSRTCSLHVALVWMLRGP